VNGNRSKAASASNSALSLDSQIADYVMMLDEAVMIDGRPEVIAEWKEKREMYMKQLSK
jgi:hypothetical protein